MNKVALGLDVAKKTIEVCLLRQGQKRGEKLIIENSIAGGQKLLSWLHGIDPSEIHVCLEPTGKYSRVIAAFVHTSGLKVSQVNSFTVLHHGRAKGYRSKTESIDAYLLADYCLKENPPSWEPPATSYMELSEMQARLDELEETIGQERNRLQAGGDSAVVQQDIQDHLVQLTMRKERLFEAMKAHVDADPLLYANFKIAESIIGIGEKSALALLSAVRFERFEAARNVGSFAGLTPRRYESGTSIYKRPCISRKGSNKLRKRLYFPAMVAMQCNPQMREFADRLRANGKPSKVIICAVMRKLLVLTATLIRKQEFYDRERAIKAS
jgi:transposase